MRAVRLGSYSMCATFAGTPSLFRRKSTIRYRRLVPPPPAGQRLFYDNVSKTIANGNVLIVTGKRRAIDYFLEPLTQRMRRAFRES